MSAGQGSPSTVSSWNLPNALTVARVLVVPVFVVLLVRDDGESTASRAAAFAVFAAAIATDRLDGWLARRMDAVTDFGKVADPIADKALIGSGLIGLSVTDRLAWWVTIVILGREVAVTVVRFAVLRYGVMPAGRGGKLKTMLQSVAVGLFVLPLEVWIGGWMTGVAWAVMLAAVALTVVTGVDYLGKAMRLRAVARQG